MKILTILSLLLICKSHDLTGTRTINHLRAEDSGLNPKVGKNRIFNDDAVVSENFKPIQSKRKNRISNKDDAVVSEDFKPIQSNKNNQTVKEKTNYNVVFKRKSSISNTFKNLVKKIAVFVSLYFSYSNKSDLAAILDVLVIALRTSLVFIKNEQLEKFYEEILPIYTVLVVFRIVIGNFMSLTNTTNSNIFKTNTLLLQYAIFAGMIFIIPVLICYLLLENNSFKKRKRIHKAILFSFCFYYSFFLFAPLQTYLNSDGVFELTLPSFFDLSGIFFYGVKYLANGVVPLYFVKAVATLIKVCAFFFSSYIISKIYDCVISINSSNIFVILYQFYLGDEKVDLFSNVEQVVFTEKTS